MAQIIENGSDDVGVGDICDDAERSSTVWAKGNVDFKHPSQPLCPGQRCSRRSARARGRSVAAVRLVRAYLVPVQKVRFLASGAHWTEPLSITVSAGIVGGFLAA